MSIYYNENDSKISAWLRNLAQQNHIDQGVVDERSIEDVAPAELRRYRQCHFFAGIGGWPYALRLAGWPPGAEVWTGSCPCQPFSAAGRGGGFADQRHLWPAWYWLIAQRRPAAIFGEQVDSPAGRAWLDLVQTDLEAAGYACGAVHINACSVGAPHIRGRLYWVAYANGKRLAERVRHGRIQYEALEPLAGQTALSGGAASWLGYSNCKGVRRRPNQAHSPQNARKHKLQRDIT